jgi:hypothetical protein
MVMLAILHFVINRVYAMRTKEHRLA